MADLDATILRLKEHILELSEESGNKHIDDELFNECEALLPKALAQNPQVLKEIISLLSRLLTNLRQDSSRVIQFLSKLVGPLSFYDVIHLDPPVDFSGGLALSAEQYHDLVISLISKAAQASKDAAILAGMPTVVFSLVKLWLCSPDMGVADRAGKVLVDLLTVDMEETEVQAHGFGNGNLLSGGQGLMWRRMFGDKDIYRLLYSIPSLNSSSNEDISKSQKSIAQARLMTFLLKVGNLDWNYIVKSHHPEVESAYGLKPGEGLLQFISLYAVDSQNDVLIHLNLIQFFSDLLSGCQKLSQKTILKSVSLEFLEEHGLHKDAMSYWLHGDDPAIDPVDKSFLQGASANYVATYAQVYQNAFLATDEARLVLLRLLSNLDLSANQWAHGQSPKHDLHILSSLPRVALLPQRQFGTGRRSTPLFLVPCTVANEDALNCLSRVFSPLSNAIDAQSNNSIDRDVTPDPEAQAARALLHAYYPFHESFFSDMTRHADTVALPDKAIAAYNVMTSLSSRDFPALPETSRFPEAGLPRTSDSLPSESQMKAAVYPFSRTAAYFEPNSIIFLQPPARSGIMQWLLRPPPSFSNIVGGLGDTDSAAYRVAAAKYDLLRLFHRSLQVPSAGVDAAEQAAVKRAVEDRLREGLFGTSSEVGGRVATLEL